MKIEVVDIKTVKPNPSNPRVLKDEKFKLLCESLTKFPKMLLIRPIVVNDDMIVLGGNQRLKACQHIGLKKIAIIRASELTEEEQREFIIRDNVGFGEWDLDMVKKDWNQDQLTQWGLDLPDFNSETLPLDEHPNKTETPAAKEPTKTADDYSSFELVMLHENKLKLMQVLNAIKKDKGIDKLEDALMEMCVYSEMSMNR